MKLQKLLLILICLFVESGRRIPEWQPWGNKPTLKKTQFIEACGATPQRLASLN